MRIVTFLLDIIGRLPLSMLYVLSDAFAWVLRVVIGYRKEVIRTNLVRSFPSKASHEIDALVKAYYAYLADVTLETFKLHHMSEEALRRRCMFINPEVFDPSEKHGENTIIMMGHSGNWEWAGSFTQIFFRFQMLPVYRKVKDKAFNQYFLKLRSRFGAVPVLDKEAVDVIRSIPSPHAVAMLADQTPGGKKGWWTTFLHQETPFFRGSEVLAKRLQYHVVFAHVRRPARGRYEIWLEPFNGSIDNRYELTKGFVAFLEKEIELDPANWLWSHKRWKHKPSEDAVWMG